MRGAALLLVGLLALPALAAADAPSDADAALAYAARGAGALLPVAGLPALDASAAPAPGQAAQRAPLGAEQGEAVRPTGAADARWAALALQGLDAQQGYAGEDAGAFWSAWTAWLAAQAGLGPPPALPGARARPLGEASAWLRGPDITLLAPLPGGLTNRDAQVAVVAAIRSPGGVGAAVATLTSGGATRHAPMRGMGDGTWRAEFPGPPDARAPALVQVEAWDALLGQPGQEPGFAGAAWPLGYAATGVLERGVRDALPPVLHLRVPAYTNRSLLDVGIEARDDVGVADMRVGDGSRWGPWAPAGDHVEVPLASEGAATIAVQVRDAAGNRAEQRAVVTRDTEAPLAELDAPGAWSRVPVEVRAAPGASLAPAVVRLTLDGSDPRDAPALPGDALLVAGPGVVRVRAVATDAAGNVGPEVDRDVRIDDAAPRLALRTDEPLDGWLPRAPRLGVDATDDLSGLAGLEAEFVGAEGALPADPLAPAAPEGEHTLVVRARDAAGNQATLERQLRVDLTPPLTRLAEEPGLLRWRAVDAGSGVRAVTVEQRAPGGAWQSVATGGPEGSVPFAVPPGEVREVRAWAEDLVGHVESKARPDLVLRGPAPRAPPASPVPAAGPPPAPPAAPAPPAPLPAPPLPAEPSPAQAAPGPAAPVPTPPGAPVDAPVQAPPAAPRSGPPAALPTRAVPGAPLALAASLVALAALRRKP